MKSPEKVDVKVLKTKVVEVERAEARARRPGPNIWFAKSKPQAYSEKLEVGSGSKNWAPSVSNWLCKNVPPSNKNTRFKKVDPLFPKKIIHQKAKFYSSKNIYRTHSSNLINPTGV